MFSPLHSTATFSLEKATAPSVRNGKWLLEVSQRLRASRVCPPSVAFPNRKSIIFDNKLDFSGTKLAESWGFGIPTSEFLQSEIVKWKLCHWCSSSNLSVHFRHRGNRWVVSTWLRTILRVCIWQPSHLAAVLLWCLLKVRLCSPLQLGNNSCRCVVRLPQLLRLALPKPIMHESLW